MFRTSYILTSITGPKQHATKTLCPFLVKRRMSPTPRLTMSNPTGTFMKLKASWGGGYRKHFQPSTWKRKEQSRASSWKCSTHLSSFHSFSFAKVCSPLESSVPQISQIWLPCFHTNHKRITKEIMNKEKVAQTLFVCAQGWETSYQIILSTLKKK